MSDLIPIRLAEQACANLLAEIDCHKAENACLKAEVERLQHLANQSDFYRSQLQKDTCRLENIKMQDAFKHYEAENARLKAEVERLGAFRTHTIIPNEILKAENARLHAEVERLRKAGDAVSICLEAYWKGNPYHISMTIQCFDAWNAAKEGKQS